MVSHCGLILSPVNGYFISFFGKMSVQVFLPFLKNIYLIDLAAWGLSFIMHDLSLRHTDSLVVADGLQSVQTSAVTACAGLVAPRHMGS